MKKLVWLVVLVLAIVVGFVLAQDLRSKREGGGPELVFFFSDSSKDLESAARALRAARAKHPKLRIRPVFLAEDFSSLTQPTTDFAAGVRELQYAVGDNFSLQIYDEGGLALARQLKLNRLPAFAVVVTRGERQRASVAYGAQANVEELLRCAK